MAKYKIQRRWPEAIFSGSLIQQNHGEELKHGYYNWDVAENRANFKEIKNEYGYYTIYIEDGIIPVLSEVPDKPRLRLKVSNTNPADLKRIKTDIRSLYNVQELTINRVDSVGSDEHQRSIDVGDVSSTNYQNDLIIDYIKRNFVIDDSLITKIQEINSRLNQKLDEEELAKSIQWKPIRFEFSNMFSYSGENKIVFDEMDGIVGIFAENASGKSSIFGALSFCLFDKAPRAYKAINILNTQKNSFECELEFEIDGTRFVINRRGEKDASGHIPVDVEFYKIGEDGERISLNGEYRSDTNRIIRQYVGEYEDFILTTLSVQNNNTVFIDKSQSERKDVLAQFIGIDVFEKLYRLAKDESRDLKAVMKEFKKTDLSSDYQDAKNEYDRLVKEYEEYGDQKSELLDQKSDILDDIMELNKTLLDVPEKDLDVGSLNNRLERIKNDLENYRDKKKLAVIKKKEKEQAKLGLENIIDSANKDELKKEFDNYNQEVKRLDKLNSEINSLKNSISKNESSLDHLKNHSEFDPNCEYCVKRNEKDAKKIGELEKAIGDEKQTLSNLKQERDQLQDLIDESDVESRWEKYRDTERRINKHQSFISERELEVSKYENKIQNLNSKKESIKSDISLYHEIKDSLEHNNSVQVEIKQKQNDLQSVETEINQVESKMRDIHGQIKVAENKKSEINKKISRFEELSTEYEAYEYYISAIKRDGVPYELIEKSLPGIEEEVNNILSQIVDFSIVFETDGKYINAWMVSGEDEIVPLDNASGMEGFVSSLAIRVALTNISNLPRSNFLAIDEGFGVLDAEKRNSLIMVFDYFKSNFEFVLFVTHLDSLRDIANDILEVEKQNGFSKVQYL